MGKLSVRAIFAGFAMLLTAGCGSAQSASSQATSTASFTSPASSTASLVTIVSGAWISNGPLQTTGVPFPGLGTGLTTTVTLAGGRAPYSAVVGQSCGASNASVSLNQTGPATFSIYPTSAGAADGPCPIIFSDGSTPVQSTTLTVSVLLLTSCAPTSLAGNALTMLYPMPAASGVPTAIGTMYFAGTSASEGVALTSSTGMVVWLGTLAVAPSGAPAQGAANPPPGSTVYASSVPPLSAGATYTVSDSYWNGVGCAAAVTTQQLGSFST